MSLEPVGNGFDGLVEDGFCKTEKCKQKKLELKKATKQNGMLFSTPDVDNDNYCRLTIIS